MPRKKKEEKIDEELLPEEEEQQETHWTAFIMPTIILLLVFVFVGAYIYVTAPNNAASEPEPEQQVTGEAGPQMDEEMERAEGSAALDAPSYLGRVETTLAPVSDEQNATSGTTTRFAHHFLLDSPYYSLTFRYPEYAFTDVDWSLNGLDRESRSSTVWLENVSDDTATSPLTVRIVSAAHCINDWCALEASDSVVTGAGASWDYLGSVENCDAGDCIVYPNIYKLERDGYVLYAVTEDTVHSTTSSNVVTTVFNTIEFEVHANVPETDSGTSQ